MSRQRRVNLDQLLLRAFYWVDEGLQRNLRRRGGPVVTHSQSMVISTIGEGIHRPSAIAERLGISRQAVHQCLRELVSVGLVSLQDDPKDARAKIATLKADAKPMRKEALRILDELEDALAQRIGPQRMQSLRDALEQEWGDPVDLEK